LAITFGVGYSLWVISILKSNCTSLTILAVYLFLAFGGIEAYKEVRLPGVPARIGIVIFHISTLQNKSKHKS
jgi:hypothetical protein